jgi:acyl-coenzyme A thioesterase PaaI-like protein
VGAFVSVRARIHAEAERTLVVEADAAGEDGRPLASAKGTFVRMDPP